MVAMNETNCEQISMSITTTTMQEQQQQQQQQQDEHQHHQSMTAADHSSSYHHNTATDDEEHPALVDYFSDLLLLKKQDEADITLISDNARSVSSHSMFTQSFSSSTSTFSTRWDSSSSTMLDMSLDVPCRSSDRHSNSWRNPLLLPANSMERLLRDLPMERLSSHSASIASSYSSASLCGGGDDAEEDANDDRDEYDEELKISGGSPEDEEDEEEELPKLKGCRRYDDADIEVHPNARLLPHHLISKRIMHNPSA
mmetsp:Transcript_16180/g.45294  ORF Transcript_16180/g.45294 Transcript_16180/m.45294 type:complete len:256 (+) Transcript_16180:589-1356(+)